MIDIRYSLGPGAEWGWVAPTAEGEDPFAVVPAVAPVQTHTSNVAMLIDPGQPMPDTDAVITRLKGVPVGVRTADCVPVVVYAPDIAAVAAIHAGWRGAVTLIQQKAVAMMAGMGADPAKMQARIGAAVCCGCYQVDEDLARRFIDAGYGDCVLRGPVADALTGELIDGPRPHLDLVAMNAEALRRAGIPPENIVSEGVCTRHTPVCPAGADGASPCLPSWRRQPGITDRILTWIRIL